MKIIYPFLALLLLLNVSCSTAPTMSALDYNDAIINEQSSIANVMMKFGDVIETSIDQAEILRKEIISQCDSSLNKLKDLPKLDGSTEFNNAGIALFNFYKDISGKEYRQILDILKKEEIDDNDLEELQNIQGIIETKEAKFDNRFQSAQKEFARKNNITIGDNKLQQLIDDAGQ